VNCSICFSAPAPWKSLPKDLHLFVEFQEYAEEHICFVPSLMVSEKRALVSLHLHFVAQYKFFVIIIINTLVKKLIKPE